MSCIGDSKAEKALKSGLVEMLKGTFLQEKPLYFIIFAQSLVCLKSEVNLICMEENIQLAYACYLTFGNY